MFFIIDHLISISIFCQKAHHCLLTKESISFCFTVPVLGKGKCNFIHAISPFPDFCEFCGIEYLKILKHISVRWLSLENVVTRVLKLYEALVSYFKSNSKYFNVKLSD